MPSKLKMTFNKRLKILERNAPTYNYIPPIIIHTIVEPSDNGPREVGAYATVSIDGIYFRLERENGENQEQFEKRIKKINK